MIQPAYCTSYPLPNSIVFQDITSIATHSGNLWLGTRHGAIAKWNGEEWSIHLEGKGAKHNVTKFVFNKRGIPAVKFNTGDFFFPEGAGVFYQERNFVEIANGVNGAVYGLSEKADLLILEDSTWRRLSSVPEVEYTSSEMPNNIFQSGDDLWVLISENIYRYNIKTENWKTVKMDATLPNQISGIRPALNGESLIGLDGYEWGIYYECEDKFSRSGFAKAQVIGDSLAVLQHYTVNNSELSSDVVFDVIAGSASGQYWAITGHAPDKVDLDNNWESETRFGNVSAISRDSAGNFLIGRTDGGVMLYDHKEIVNWSLPSLPTDVKQSGQPFQKGEFDFKKTSRGYVLKVPRSHAGKKFRIFNFRGQTIWQSHLVLSGE